MPSKTTPPKYYTPMQRIPSDLLPERKMRELKQIVKIIRKVAGKQVHKIILFGSHARGDWVEDIYVEDGATFEYMSDFDIMVISEDNKLPENMGLQYKINQLIDSTRFIKTWNSIIYEDINHINKEINLHNYFYCDVMKEGYLLYDSGKLKINEKPPVLTKQVRKKIAREHYEIWTNRAEKFIKNAKFSLKQYKKTKDQEDLNLAAFMLHQATEAYMTAVRLVYTGYKPKTHDLKELYRKILALDRRFTAIFPQGTKEEKKIFDLLRKAYTDARFKKSYKVNEKQVENMIVTDNWLKVLTKKSCEEKIKNI